MSDSVTNVDVEDVLSSIRRLVSDTNSDVRSAPKPESDAPEKEASDAFLLTSELRVHAETTEPEAAPEEGDAHTAELSNLRGAITAKDAVSDEYYEDDEPEDVSPVISFMRHDRTEAEVAPEAEHEVTSETSEDDAEDEPSEWTPQFVDESESVNEDSEQTNEPSETEIEIIEDDAPFEFVEDVTVAEDLEAAPEWVEAGLAEISEAEVVEEGRAQHDDVADPEQADHETIEMPEAEAANAPSNADAASAETLFASAAAASVFSDEDEDKEEAGVADGLGDFDEGIIDEDALRDLVSEIVRQELTGELGERITRNVRKLVRREIHRAMLTREFE